MTNSIDDVLPKILYVSSELHMCQEKTVNECNSDTNVTQNMQSENDIFSEFINIINKYSEITESETNLSTNETIFNSRNSNKSKFSTLLA